MGLISKPDIFQTKPLEKNSFLASQTLTIKIKDRSEISRMIKNIHIINSFIYPTTASLSHVYHSTW